jgi:hypothetical protein
MPIIFTTPLWHSIQWHSVSAGLLVIGKNASMQFFGLFGLLFLSGMALTLVSRWTNNAFKQFVFPRFGLYVFGIIGVPLHEFCHALFAKIFLHDIESIKWFDPEGNDGSYGTVVHYYNDRNLYHRVGLFFIGLGPVLLAPLILFVGYRVFVPEAMSFSLHGGRASVQALHFVQTLLSLRNLTSIGFYVFVYFALCLTSQMELSPDDFKIARAGILPILLLLFVINATAYLFSFNLHGKLAHGFNTVLALWSACFMTALVIATANFVLCSVLLNLFHRLCGRESINPFNER